MRRLPDIKEEYDAGLTKDINRVLQSDIKDLENKTNHEVNLIEYSVVFVSSAYSAGNRSVIFADASASAVTITLPPPQSYYRKVFTVKKTNASANDITVVATSGTIDTSTSYLLTGTGFPFVTVISDGTEYKRIG